MKISQTLRAYALATLVKRKKRKIYDYATNTAFARMKEQGHADCDIKSLKDRILDPHVQDRINDHAYRRVQLFHHMAVIYHNEECLVGLDRTISQIGRGGCKKCSAAHHAILPRVWDTSMKTYKQQLIQGVRDPLFLAKLEAIGLKTNELEQDLTPSRIDSLFTQLNRDRLIGPDSHFQRCLDSTMQLPVEVNEFDCIIETHLRPIAVSLLQRVCNGLDPFIATTHFVDNMHQFFHRNYQHTQQMMVLMTQLKERKSLNSNMLAHKIRTDRLARNVLKRPSWLELLEADLLINRQQAAGTQVPPRHLLDMGLSLAEQKLMMIRG